MVNVPNLSVMTPKKEKPMKGVAPQNRLGHSIRARRNVFKETQKQTADAIAEALGNRDFTDVVLGEIERGVRPASMVELECMAQLFDMDLSELKKHAIEWHESVWNENPQYELQPRGGRAATVYSMSQAEMSDELHGALADMRRGARVLHETIGVVERTDPDLAARARSTWNLLNASVHRIMGVLEPERMDAQGDDS